MSSAVYLWKTFRAQAEQHSGVSQKVFGFSPESVFAFLPECCSESARNPVRLHPGMLFALPRNTQCIFTAPLWRRNFAQGNSDRQRSMVVESNAYRLWSRPTPMGSAA